MPNFAELRRLRDKYEGNRGMQDMLGPLEHRAFVEELWGESPVTGAAATMTAPAYSTIKWLAMREARDPASMVAQRAARRLLAEAGYPIGPMTSRPTLDEVFAALEGGARGARRTLGSWLGRDGED